MTQTLSACPDTRGLGDTSSAPAAAARPVPPTPPADLDAEQEAILVAPDLAPRILAQFEATAAILPGFLTNPSNGARMGRFQLRARVTAVVRRGATWERVTGLWETARKGAAQNRYNAWFILASLDKYPTAAPGATGGAARGSDLRGIVYEELRPEVIGVTRAPGDRSW